MIRATKKAIKAMLIREQEMILSISKLLVPSSLQWKAVYVANLGRTATKYPFQIDLNLFVIFLIFSLLIQIGFNFTKMVNRSIREARSIYPLKLMQCKSPNLYWKN